MRQVQRMVRHSTQIVFAVFMVAAGALPASACDRTGAFGLRFGERLEAAGDRDKNSGGFLVTPPRPDPEFDRYTVSIDPQSKEILEIKAIRQITPFSDNLSPEAIQEGRRQAAAFVKAYVARWTGAGVPFAYGARKVPRWQAIRDGVMWGVSGGEFAWTVDVTCVDLARFNALAHERLPDPPRPQASDPGGRP